MLEHSRGWADPSFRVWPTASRRNETTTPNATYGAAQKRRPEPFLVDGSYFSNSDAFDRTSRPASVRRYGVSPGASIAHPAAQHSCACARWIPPPGLAALYVRSRVAEKVMSGQSSWMRPRSQKLRAM